MTTPPSTSLERTEPRLRKGVGLGLRWDFLEEVLAAPPPDVAFFEVSPENYLGRGGYYPSALAQIREQYPILTHGLTLSVGGVAELDRGYLNDLRGELTRLDPPWHSDHLCFATAGTRVLHELLPLQFSEENVNRVAARVKQVADFLGRPFALENITYYVHPGEPELTELEFLQRIFERSEARLLLDVNNVYVNSQNHGYDPRAFIAGLPLERVVEIHVAGHEREDDGLLLDTHGAPIADPVFELLEWTLERTGPLPVLLERDNHVPDLAELLAEVRVLEGIVRRAEVQHAERHAKRA